MLGLYNDFCQFNVAKFWLFDIRHRSVTCNRIISMSTGSRFRVINHDQNDHHANCMALVRDPVTKELRKHFDDEYVHGTSGCF